VDIVFCFVFQSPGWVPGALTLHCCLTIPWYTAVCLLPVLSCLQGLCTAALLCLVCLIVGGQFRTITCRQIRLAHSSVCQGSHTLAHPSDLRLGKGCKTLLSLSGIVLQYERHSQLRCSQATCETSMWHSCLQVLLS
jgi:hypothetical protein